MLLCFTHYTAIPNTDDVQGSDSSIDRLALLLSRCVRPVDPQLVSAATATGIVCDRALQLLQVYQHILSRSAQLSLIVTVFR
jgi:hypothetical protein